MHIQHTHKFEKCIAFTCLIAIAKFIANTLLFMLLYDLLIQLFYYNKHT